jgi:hypothetical protein
MWVRAVGRTWSVAALIAGSGACGGGVRGATSNASSEHGDSGLSTGGFNGVATGLGGSSANGGATQTADPSGGTPAIGGNGGSNVPGAGGSASGSQGGAGYGGALASDAGSGGSFACAAPVPVTKEGSSTGPSGGFVRCADGAVHRPAASECWSELDTPDASAPVPGAAAASPCRTNADCTALPHGYCTTFPNFSPFPPYPPSIGCAYGCVRDSDCGLDELCRCGSPIGTCVRATCRADTDCPDSVPCLEVRALPGPCSVERVTFSCGGVCRSNSDCGPQGVAACYAGKCVTLPQPC